MIEAQFHHKAAHADQHMVQFYDDETFLSDQIWDFIRPCLQAGETAIVIAAAPRLATLEARSSGHRASGSRSLIALDAETVLSSIIGDDGWPDPALFNTVVGETMRAATDNGRRHARAYGEMVALLCAAGRPDAAIRLEQLWNELGKEYPFSLLCGYPMNAFTKEEDGTSFRDICNAHTRVLLAESDRPPPREEELHRTIAALRQKANALESEVARRREIERALQRREQELADLDRRKDEFLAMLGHELRNPLAPIMNSLELMRICTDSPQQIVRLRETIARQVKLMTRLVDDLLDVSRITRGRIELKMERAALDGIIERAVEIARPLINERRHRLTLDLPADPIYLWCDPARLAQVLSNLLHNAAKYTDAGGSISLGAREEGRELVLTVGDDGIGIAAELQDKVFELFMQDAEALAKARGGLGLGLTLVRSLVQLHGGSVIAKSDGPGCGSEFIVTLPLRMPANAAPHASGAANDMQPARSRMILIVDDNIDAAESLGEFLRVAGHRVHIAHDGVAAIRAATRLRPEVVILDIGMPAMNGYQVAQRLRTEVGLSTALLVAVTGYAQERDRVCAKEAGFDHHFAKPLDIGRLAAILNNADYQ